MFDVIIISAHVTIIACYYDNYYCKIVYSVTGIK